MSDKELNINIRTAADTAGAQQTAEALNKVKEAAQATGESAEAINAATDAEQENAKATEQNTQSKEKSTTAKKKRKKATEDETKAAKDNKQATEAATQAVDKDTRERTENTTAVEKQGNALEQTGKKGEQAGVAVAKGSRQGAEGVKRMGNGALQAAYFFDDLQYGIRGIMNNIPGLVMGFGGSMGLAGAMSLAVLAGKVLYDLLDETDEKGKSAAENAKQLVEAEKERLKNLFEEVEKLRRDEDNNSALERELEMSRQIAENRKDEAEALEYAYNYRKRLIDLESGIADDKAEEERLKVEEDFANGKFGTGKEAERKRRRLLLGIEMDSNARRRAEKEERAQIDVSESSVKKFDAAKTERELRKAMQDAGDDVIMTLDDRKKIEADLIKKSNDLNQDFLDKLKDLRDKEALIKSKQGGAKGGADAALFKSILDDNNLKKSVDEWVKGYSVSSPAAAHFIAKNLDEIIKSRRNDLFDKNESISLSDNALEYKGYNLGDGTSGEKGYSDAYTEYYKTLEELKKKQAEAQKDLAKAEEAEIEATRKLAEVRLKNSSEAAVDTQKVKTAEAKERRQIKDEDEKRQNQEKKRLEQEAKKKAKEAERKQKQEADKLFKTLVEGILLDTGSATPQQALSVKKSVDAVKRDAQAALSNDGQIDVVEMAELLKNLSAKLQENGITSEKTINLLCTQFERILHGVESQSRSFKALEKRVLNIERRERAR